MPPSYLRHSCRCCLRHRSDMRTEVAGNRGHVSLYRRHACEVELAGMPVVKIAMFLVAGGVVSSCRRSIAGSTSGHVAGTSAAYENQA